MSTQDDGRRGTEHERENETADSEGEREWPDTYTDEDGNYDPLAEVVMTTDPYGGQFTLGDLGFSREEAEDMGFGE